MVGREQTSGMIPPIIVIVVVVVVVVVVATCHRVVVVVDGGGEGEGDDLYSDSVSSIRKLNSKPKLS